MSMSPVFKLLLRNIGILIIPLLNDIMKFDNFAYN